MPEVSRKKSLQHQSAVYKSWANTEDWTARTSHGRKAFEDKFLKQSGGDPKRAAALRKHFFKELARKSTIARARRKEQQQPVDRRETADALETLNEGMGT